MNYKSSQNNAVVKGKPGVSLQKTGDRVMSLIDLKLTQVTFMGFGSSLFWHLILSALKSQDCV